ncbi:hypothetical protein JZ751_000211, partial [Albula glossodonta]
MGLGWGGRTLDSVMSVAVTWYRRIVNGLTETHESGERNIEITKLEPMVNFELGRQDTDHMIAYAK